MDDPRRNVGSNQPDVDNTEETRAQELVRWGSNLGGPAIGAAVGVLASPVVGAVAGVVATEALRRVGETLIRVGAEVQERWFAPREQQRTGWAYREVVVATDTKIKAGSTVREDTFFEPKETGQSDAEELLEATLQHAARTYQEQKVPYLARLWPNVVVSGDISAAYAHMLSQLADDLTYDGMVALALIEDQQLEAEKMDADVARDEGTPWRPDAIAELDRLASFDLVGVRNDSEEVLPPQQYPAARGFRDLPLARAALTSTGEDLYRVLDLNEVPPDDQRAFLERLRGVQS